jgi:DNA-binding NtrC family response regulator
MILQSSSAALHPRTNDLGLTNAPGSDNGFEGMIGNSLVMREVYELTRRVAATNATVLLNGHRKGIGRPSPASP